MLSLTVKYMNMVWTSASWKAERMEEETGKRSALQLRRVCKQDIAKREEATNAPSQTDSQHECHSPLSLKGRHALENAGQVGRCR